MSLQIEKKKERKKVSTPTETWEIPVSGLWIDDAQAEACEIVVSWRLIADYYDDPQSIGGSIHKVEIVEIKRAYGLESGYDYTQSARQTYGLKHYLEEIITERLEV